ncbi:glutamate mutase L [Kineosporia sp. R_H_3]|uniref:glutamate mutase L n=1 Tax=Kineosporia sp. R_H_3 TaxID=1961848 RepID=UPI000B4C193D|nr:glutamate mutase L [Kineosporia sp. R_H_3]
MSDVLCVDVGSTFTKAALVDTATGDLLATASHPTTLASDVLDGVAAVRADAERAAGRRADDVLVCSSAGGGLRIAVVGYERLVTAEAGHRVALSAGGKVVHVAAGPLDGPGDADPRLDDLRAAAPDVVLLVGGTDGGNAEVLLHNARRLGIARLPVPVVLAGNADAADEARAELERRRRHVVVTANVLPRIGVLDPLGARAAIREVFLSHVIGGKGLSKGPAFARLVRAATPDAVLAGVEALADGSHDVPGADDVRGAGDVLVVDVGGATTDVYSVLTPEGEDAALAKEVVATLWRARTVEGDLGMRWGAPGVVAAAVAERLLEPGDATTAALAAHAERARAEPAWVPGPGTADGAAARDLDTTLARLAVTVALRRHGRPATPSASPRPLRDVALVVGSGGVLRHADAATRAAVLAPATSDHAGGWRVPDRARVVVDGRYTLFAAGLLAAGAPVAAARLARSITSPG